jgi:hypothetical protein
MVAIEKVRLVNPHKRKRATAKRRGVARKKTGRRTNPAEILTLGFVNPEGRKKSMAKAKRRGSSAAKRRTNGAGKRRRRNPMMFGRKRHAAHRRRRRNPSGGFVGGISEMFKQGFFALLGLVITRQVPQMLLGAKNAGALGYGANVGTMLASGFLASKFVGKSAGSAVTLGGGLYTVNRLLNDYISPVGRVLSLQGMGDAQAVGFGGGLRGIQPGYFPTPVPTDAAGRPIIPPEIRAVPPALPAPAKAGMAGIANSSRFVGRF